MSTCPSDRLKYLLTQAATISVPPVEPLFRNTTANADPVKQQPITNDMKAWPSPNIWMSLPSSPIIIICANFNMKYKATIA